MNSSATADALITDAQVRAILDHLNAGDAGLDDLDRWAAGSRCKPDRVIVGPDTVYVRLAGRAEHGGPVILTYARQAWGHASRQAPGREVQDIARHRAQRRGATPGLPHGSRPRAEREAQCARSTAERFGAQGGR